MLGSRLCAEPPSSLTQSRNKEKTRTVTLLLKEIITEGREPDVQLVVPSQKTYGVYLP